MWKHPEISDTLGLVLGLDIQGSVSSGLGLENYSYPMFPSLGLETETNFESLSLGLIL